MGNQCCKSRRRLSKPKERKSIEQEKLENQSCADHEGNLQTCLEVQNRGAIQAEVIEESTQNIPSSNNANVVRENGSYEEDNNGSLNEFIFLENLCEDYEKMVVEKKDFRESSEINAITDSEGDGCETTPSENGIKEVQRTGEDITEDRTADDEETKSLQEFLFLERLCDKYESMIALRKELEANNYKTNSAMIIQGFESLGAFESICHDDFPYSKMYRDILPPVKETETKIANDNLMSFEEFCGDSFQSCLQRLKAMKNKLEKNEQIYDYLLKKIDNEIEIIRRYTLEIQRFTIEKSR